MSVREALKKIKTKKLKKFNLGVEIAEILEKRPGNG